MANAIAPAKKSKIQTARKHKVCGLSANSVNIRGYRRSCGEACLY